MVDLSSYAITGTNNPNKQVSVTFWNGFVDTLETAINAASGATVTISDVTGLQAALDGKQASGSYQPLDADLSAIAANITAAGHALLDDADAAAQRATLGLGTAATLSTGDIDERARDALGAALVAGTNITLTPNDAGDTITIAAGGAQSIDSAFISQAELIPISGSTTVSNPGMTTNSFTNASLTRSAATLAQSLQGCQHDSGSTAGGIQGYACGNPSWWRGNASGLGGFIYRQRMSIGASMAANSAFAWGLKESTAQHTAVDVSSMVNCVFFGADGGDSNLQLMHNDASGACTKIDLGANFPARTVHAVYACQISCSANGSGIAYSISRLDTPASTSGTILADLPANTAFMGPMVAAINKTTGGGRSHLYNHGMRIEGLAS